MGGAWGRIKMHARFCQENLKVKDYLQVLGIDGLRKKQVAGVCKQGI
jgi:hypothetical protein